MRLTNTMRDAFVRAAMNDVPQVDYNERVSKLVEAEVKAEFAKDFPGADYDKLVAAGWLEQSWYATPRGLSNPYVYMPPNFAHRFETRIGEQVAAMATASRTQDNIRDELEAKLKSVAYSVSTREALAKALPEFEKYLPEAPDAVAKNLPAVANIVADFSRAGWPKGKVAEVAP